MRVSLLKSIVCFKLNCCLFDFNCTGLNGDIDPVKPGVKKNRQSTPEATICIRFQTGLTFWMHNSMKNCAKNKLISIKIQPFPHFPSLGCFQRLNNQTLAL